MLSIWSAYYLKLSPEDAVSELKKWGINSTELSDEHGLMLLERGDPTKVGHEFKDFLNKIGMTVTQGHLDMFSRLLEDGATEKIMPWIKLFSAVGIKNAVLHCDGQTYSDSLDYKTRLEKNIKALLELKEKIKDFDIVICLENLPEMARNSAELLYILKKLNSNKFGICLDTGHLNITKEANETQEEFILNAGKNLKALHLHDNEGELDQHIMPFGRGTIDFSNLYEALCSIGYEGLYNYEIPGERWRQPPLEILGYKLEYIIKFHEYLCRKTQKA